MFVSHDAAAVERLCERGVLLRHGEKVFDGPVREAIARYRRELASDLDPAERTAGLREWGTGEAEISDARLLDRDGAERTQFLAGEPLVVSLAVDAGRPIPAPRLHLELRDDADLLVAEELTDTATLGWNGAPGRLLLRLEIPDPPLAFGRFHLRLGLVAEDDRLLHQLDDALVFVVYPDGEGRGLVRLEGTWSSDAKQEVPMSYKTCPDWPELMELAPDLQFKHMAARLAQLPFEVITRLPGPALDEAEICCDLEHHVYYGAHTHPQVAEALVGTHWFEVNEWATSGPGTSSNAA